MMLKNDRWIIEQAEQGMITPFEPQQVRQLNLEGGMIPAISYGVSSYGYDIRLSPSEFLVFKHIPGTVVNPKAFNPGNLEPVPLQSDPYGSYFIIPANSYGLGVSLEAIVMPPTITAICMGKSTYARCFRGDTRVALVDGSSIALEDMARRYENGESFWGYSLNELGRVIVTALHAPRYIGTDSIIEIILDNGESIFATPDHNFITRDGRYVIADSLRPGDSLMPLYRQLERGYEMVYQPLNGQLHPTHRLADEWNIRHEIYADTPNTHRHHIDHNRRNNLPINIMRMNASDHIRHHNDISYGDDFDPLEHGAAVSDALKRLSQDEAWRQRYSQAQRERSINYWNKDEYAVARAKHIQKYRDSWTDERRAQKRAEMEVFFADPLQRERVSQRSKAAWNQDNGTRRQQQQEIARQIRLRPEITEEVVRQALDETGSIRGAARLLNCDRAVFRRFPEVIGTFKGAKQGRNHKVTAIRSVAGTHDVYCLTVPEAGNFGLEAGVFVQNCGLIVNVTPLEAGWVGQGITLEFSNASSADCRVYANEGVAQLLFLEGEPCLTTYKARQGKYQNQSGRVTLAKV